MSNPAVAEDAKDETNAADNNPGNPDTIEAMDTEVEADAPDDAAKPELQNDTTGLRRESVDNEEIGPEGSTRANSATQSTTAVQKVASLGGFKIRPDLADKFRPGVVQLVIERTLKEFLEGRSYPAEEAAQWTRRITNAIHCKVKELDYKRYKLVTFVVLGEYRGGGISVSNRCLWDADSDCKATYKFINDSLFCVGSVYGFYFY